MMKHIIDMHRQSFDNCFSMMVTLQLQAENILHFFHYLPIMSEDGKEFMKQRTDAYKKWIDDLKRAMDEGYARLESYCDHQTMNMLRDQTEKMCEFYLNHEHWMPGNLSKTMQDLDTLYKKGCDEFKQYVDENMRRLQNHYAKVPPKKQKPGSTVSVSTGRLDVKK